MSNEVRKAVEASARMIVSAGVVVGPLQDISPLHQLGAFFILSLWILVPLLDIGKGVYQELRGNQ